MCVKKIFGTLHAPSVSFCLSRQKKQTPSYGPGGSDNSEVRESETLVWLLGGKGKKESSSMNELCLH
jgi:hypothetical protein